jgi:hypothetical protein
MVKIPESQVSNTVDEKMVSPPHNVKIRQDQRRYQESRALWNKMKHFADELKDLRNYSKSGNVDGAYGVTSIIANKNYNFGKIQRESGFQIIACSLVFLDAGNLSALFHAAKSGHANLVRIYLSIIILSRSLRYRTKVNATTEKSFLEWFQILGPIVLKKYKLFCPNSLNQKVKFVFKSERHTLENLWKILLQSPWSKVLPNSAKIIPTLKSKRKPMLKFDEPLFKYQDEYDHYCVEPYYYDDPEEYIGTEMDANNYEAPYLDSEDQSAIAVSSNMSWYIATNFSRNDPGSTKQGTVISETISSLCFLDDDNEGNISNAIWTADEDDWSLVSDRISSSCDVLSFVDVDDKSLELTTSVLGQRF